LVELRERFADLQNAFLEEYGHADRVDHRSLADQGIDRIPEKHLGWIDSQKQASKDFLLEYREANQSLDQHLAYLPQHLAKLDREQQQEQPKPLSNAQKQEIVDQKIAEAKETTAEYQQLFEKYRIQYVYLIIYQELKKYKEQSAGIRQQIEDMDQNKPMLFGRTEWEEQREQLLRQHREIGDLHEHTKTTKRSQLLDDQRFGREAVIQHIEKNHPDLNENFNKAQEFLNAVAQLREYQQRQEREKAKENQKDQDNDLGYEMSM